MTKEFEEEFFIPGGEFHFSCDGTFVWMCVQDVEGHLSDEGEILRRVVLAGAGVVFVEDHIERPVKIVLDAPMFSVDLHQLARRQSLRQSDVIGERRRLAVAFAPLVLDSPEHRKPRHVRRVFRRGDDADAAPLESVVAALARLAKGDGAALVGFGERLRRARARCRL